MKAWLPKATMEWAALMPIGGRLEAGFGGLLVQVSGARGSRFKLSGVSGLQHLQTHHRNCFRCQVFLALGKMRGVRMGPNLRVSTIETICTSCGTPTKLQPLLDTLSSAETIIAESFGYHLV